MTKQEIEQKKTGQTIPRLEVGQAVLAEFRTLSDAGETKRGRVVYVHPENRYVTVQAGFMRESFKPWEVEVI